MEKANSIFSWYGPAILRELYPRLSGVHGLPYDCGVVTSFNIVIVLSVSCDTILIFAMVCTVIDTLLRRHIWMHIVVHNKYLF